MTNDEIINLVKDLTGIATGGLMNAQQLSEFIETTIEMSDFLREVRVESGIATQLDLDTLGINSRVLRGIVEGQRAAGAGVNPAKRSLVPTDMILPMEVGFSYLRKALGGNPSSSSEAGNKVNAAIIRAMQKQLATDSVDLAWNGDKSLVADPFLKLVDGFLVKAAACNTVLKGTFSANDKIKDVLKAMKLKLPSKYKINPADLKFYMNPNTEDQYRDELGEKNTTLGDIMIAKNEPAYYKSILCRPLFAVPENKIMLTIPANLVLGYGQTFSTETQRQVLLQQLDIAMTTSLDANFVIPEAVVLFTKEESQVSV
jgi:hypothetical protein